MELVPDQEIFEVVARYLADEIGLRELYAWMVDHTDWVVAASDSPGSALANLVEFHLSEMSVFRSSEDALRRDLETFTARGRKT